MEKRELKEGDVVQIDPELKNCFFKGAFMTVIEPKDWGAEGYIATNFSRTNMPSQAYFRATWDQMQYIGPAAWVVLDVESAELKGDNNQVGN